MRKERSLAADSCCPLSLRLLFLSEPLSFFFIPVLVLSLSLFFPTTFFIIGFWGSPTETDVSSSLGAKRTSRKREKDLIQPRSPLLVFVL